MRKRVKLVLQTFVITLTCLLPNGLSAQETPKKPECWGITNIKGFSAQSDENYSFAQDRIKSTMLLCFEGNSGTVTGTDTKLMRFGDSTLAGMVQKGDLELFEVYQIDRMKNKLLYSKSRVGTKTAYPFLPDIISSFVGDAKQVSK